MKRGTLDHMKLHALCGMLGVPRYSAAGILECLWHMTAQFALDGRIGKYSPQAIAGWMEWPMEKAGDLVDALVASGWLDREGDDHATLSVHDWEEHADHATQMRMQRKRQRALACDGGSTTEHNGARCALACDGGSTTEHNGAQRATACKNGLLPEPLPVPKPVPKPEPGGEEGASAAPADAPPTPRRVMQRPTVEEVREYCRAERNNQVDPQRFVDFYTANGWRVGKNPMRDWKAAVRTWESGQYSGGGGGNGHVPGWAAGLSRAEAEAILRAKGEGVPVWAQKLA